MKTRTKYGKKSFFRKVYENRILLLMIAPAVIYFFIFAYVPMPGIILAFQQFTLTGGLFDNPWVGFENFRFFFVSGDAFRVTMNTFMYNGAFLFVNTILQCGVAILLAELGGKWFKKITQSLMFLPYFISWVVVGAFVYNILNFEFGALNTLLRNWGLDPVDVYGNPPIWRLILIVARAWKDLGYGIVLYLAAIMSIDQEMYEAADIDGANVFQKIRSITLPSLVPVIIILTLLTVSHMARGDFQMFYNIIGNNGMLFRVTDIIDTYVFRSLIRVQEFGMSAAVGAYQSVLNLVIILTVNGIVRKVRPEYALF
ncbi:MAG: ABC transporter permease subunit [Defluviitaleaceae bacterium]|nr:ABC transporter permease subunit [Defluviitaleaceae bacterium]